MIQFRNIVEVRQAAPFPWTQQVYGNGIVRMIDARGVEVPLFAITNLALHVTDLLHRSDNQPTAAPEPVAPAPQSTGPSV